jgi:hypothetical protein
MREPLRPRLRSCGPAAGRLPSRPRSYGIAASVLTLLLGGCAASTPISNQPLRIRALVDPALAPYRGCGALSGEWRNEGQRVADGRIQSAIFTGATRMADELPDTAFADRVRIEPHEDGSLSITAFDRTSPSGSLRIAPQDITCEADGAVLRRPASVRLAVDSQGALWVRSGRLSDGYRFVPIHAPLQDCRDEDGGWPAPDGMAVVLTGTGDEHAVVMHVDDDREAAMMIMGVQGRSNALYLLPGEHRFEMRVWAPGTYWAERPQRTRSVTGTLQACHTYTPVGRHREGEPGWAGLVDLGPGFQVSSCAGTFNYPEDRITLDEDETRLQVPEGCFHRPRAGAIVLREYPLPPAMVSP